MKNLIEQCIFKNSFSFNLFESIKLYFCFLNKKSCFLGCAEVQRFSISLSAWESPIEFESFLKNLF